VPLTENINNNNNKTASDFSYFQTLFIAQEATPTNYLKTTVRQHFFAERVIKTWNSLRVAPHDFNGVNSFRICLYANDFSKFLVFI